VAQEQRLGGRVDSARDLKAVVNRALSLVTIRSLLTLEAVMVCSLMIVIMGATSLHSFALAVTFGLLNATYTT
jgi:preprotein translocase subunit SecF